MLRRIAIGLMMLPLSQAVVAAVPVVTISDIGRPVEIMHGVCVYSEAKGFSFKTDPIEGAMGLAFEKIAAKAEEMGADAVLGADLDFENRTTKDEGRVILCGTLVKYIEE